MKNEKNIKEKYNKIIQLEAQGKIEEAKKERKKLQKKNALND